ncbi:anti-sigma regulatory factor [Micromonospora rosaria]|uniref:Anti-sigma regulatory factor n=2 Tax=Micromonospora rosaria TaxID=47874 RepID=A0A136PUH2_9ACTN|nr:anti-sigma regulatory factor [Micromonospora rosaria]
MAPLQFSPPAPDAVEVRRWALTTGAELSDLRTSLHRMLTGEALLDGEKLDEVPEQMALVATELATNALRHGLPPTIVTLLSAEDCLVIDVADHDLASVPELADTRPVGSGGRGLLLARSFSLAVGWYATAHTKHVWATFPRRAGRPHP